MIGDNIKRIRELEGITQEELADRACVSQYSVSSYEKGKTSPTVTVLFRLAKTLDIPVASLLGIKTKFTTEELERVLKRTLNL